MTLTHSLRIALFAGVSFAAMGHGVLAQDADDFTAKIKAAYDAFGYDLQFGTATADGDTITIDGLTVVITTLPEPMEPYTLDTVLTFSGVTQLDDGSYKVAELTVPDVDITIDGDRVVVQSIAFRNLYIPGSDNPTILEALSVFGQFSAGPIVVEAEGKTFITVAAVIAENVFTPAPGTGTLESMVSFATVDGIEADFSIIPDADAQAVLAALGIETITGSLRETMTWTMSDGHMAIDEFSFTFDDLGRIDMTFDLVGYTPALIESARAAQKQMLQLTEEGNTAELQKAQEAFGITFASQLSLGGVAIRYDDASLAGRLLDFFAAQQNLETPDLVDALKTLAAAQIPPVLGEPLTSQINDAMGAFLDDPQSFEVSIAPAEPINLMMLAVLAAQPQAMLPMLNLSILANDGPDTMEEAPAEETVEEEAPAETSTPMDASPAEEPAAETIDKLGN